MTNREVLALILGIVFTTLTFKTVGIFQKDKVSKTKVLDLPEEFNLIKEGDTLQAYKVTTDSIYLGYYNLKNR